MPRRGKHVKGERENFQKKEKAKPPAKKPEAANASNQKTKGTGTLPLKNLHRRRRCKSETTAAPPYKMPQTHQTKAASAKI